MTYPQDWDTAQQKLTSLFPDKTVRGKILGRLLSKEVKNRLEYFRDKDEVVKASLEVLLPEGGPSCTRQCCSCAAGLPFVAGQVHTCPWSWTGSLLLVLLQRAGRHDNWQQVPSSRVVWPYWQNSVHKRSSLAQVAVS